MLTIPNTVKNTPDGKISFDLISRILDDNIILVTGEINDDMAAIVVAQLLYLDARGANEISMYINSPGGSVTAGMAIIDTMSIIKAKVSTICVGMAASMGAMILLSGTKGRRMITPHSEVMIHQPLGGAQGQATDIINTAKHIERTKETINRMIAAATGQDYNKVVMDTDRDNYMNAEEAIAYGIVDKIV